MLSVVDYSFLVKDVNWYNLPMSFWNDLQQKGMIVGLSPMDGVTDAPFRYMVAKYSKPDVMFTEFISVDALHHSRGEKREQLLKSFVYDEMERPIVAQVFGKTPELFIEAARLIESLGFDGMDINMGCPSKTVSEHGCGAGLIRTPEQAVAIVRAAKAATTLPVSVKTRLGVTDKGEMEEWIEAIMEAEPANLSLHGRTLKQLYTGQADWEAIGRAAEIVHKRGGMIFGNGDIKSLEDAHDKVRKYGVDGVLVGRATFGNPAFFAGVTEPSRERRLTWCVEHAKKYEEVFGMSWFAPMRKHLVWYAHGFPGAVELRQQLVRANSAREVEQIVTSFGRG